MSGLNKDRLQPTGEKGQDFGCAVLKRWEKLVAVVFLNLKWSAELTDKAGF